MLSCKKLYKICVRIDYKNHDFLDSNDNEVKMKRRSYVLLSIKHSTIRPLDEKQCAVSVFISSGM
jgi:hypothetical protein